MDNEEKNLNTPDINEDNLPLNEETVEDVTVSVPDQAEIIETLYSSDSVTVVEDNVDADEETEAPVSNESKAVSISDVANIDPDLFIGGDAPATAIQDKKPKLKPTKTLTPNDVAPIEIDVSNKPHDYPSDAEVPVKKGLKKKTGLGFVIAAILVVAIVIAVSIFYDAGFRDKINSPLTINGEEVGSAEFSFMYHYILIDNGVDIFAPETAAMLSGPSEDPNYATTRDYFLDLTAQTMRTTQILYDDAVAHGYRIEDEHYTLANAYIDWLSGKAEEIGVPLDTYIKGVFGSQVDRNVVSNTLAKMYFAEDYGNDEKLIELSATEEQAEEAYQNNCNIYDVVSYKILRITYEQRDQAFIDTANLHANQIIEAMAGDPSTFEEIAATYFSGEAADAIAVPNSTLVPNVRYADFTHDNFRDWLFDLSRNNGDATIFTDEDGFPIILVFVNRDRQSTPLRDVRFAYIPIQSVDGGYGLPVTEAQMLAQEIYDSIETETDMQEIENRYNDQILNGTLTATHSSDTYPDKFDGVLNTWIFASERADGDKAYLETPDGIYIIYMVHISENPEWYDRVNSFIRMNNYQAFMNELEDEYSYSFNSVGISEIQDVP